MSRRAGSLLNYGKKQALNIAPQISIDMDAKLLGFLAFNRKKIYMQNNKQPRVVTAIPKRTMIGLFKDPSYAPCCYLIIKIDRDNSPLPYKGDNEKNSILVQSDQYFPSVASTFGADPELSISDARQWLDDHAVRADFDWEADVTADDPGYFMEGNG